MTTRRKKAREPELTRRMYALGAGDTPEEAIVDVRRILHGCEVTDVLRSPYADEWWAYGTR